MENTITILGTEIELEYEKIEEIKKWLLNESNWDLATDFANIIIKLHATGWNVEELLLDTSWTIGKLYDSEEENMCIIKDTQEWIDWKADYMED